jgi:hypothetical protein
MEEKKIEGILASDFSSNSKQEIQSVLVTGKNSSGYQK